MTRLSKSSSARAAPQGQRGSIRASDMGSIDLEVVGNRIEAAFWLAVAVIVGLRARRSRGRLRNLSFVAAVLLVLFGISDLVEARTGAWWHPLWLLIWKGICLTGLLLCVSIAWWLTRDARESKPTGPDGTGDA
jgi:protein-S-isoprenylcysteine O-methyltransferase Ste14